jgi:hypothetical protein
MMDGQNRHQGQQPLHPLLDSAIVAEIERGKRTIWQAIELTGQPIRHNRAHVSHEGHWQPNNRPERPAGQSGYDSA